MPKIKFTVTPTLPSDIAYLGYTQGQVVELSDDTCRRWIRRGVAVYVKEEAPVEVPAIVEETIAELPVAEFTEAFDPDRNQEETAADYVLPESEEAPSRGRPSRKL